MWGKCKSWHPWGEFDLMIKDEDGIPNCDEAFKCEQWMYGWDPNPMYEGGEPWDTDTIIEYLSKDFEVSDHLRRD